MDEFTTDHLERWLSRAIRGEDRDACRTKIMALVADYPGLVSDGRSWPEILALAT